MDDDADEVSREEAERLLGRALVVITALLLDAHDASVISRARVDDIDELQGPPLSGYLRARHLSVAVADYFRAHPDEYDVRVISAWRWTELVFAGTIHLRIHRDRIRPTAAKASGRQRAWSYQVCDQLAMFDLPSQFANLEFLYDVTREDAIVQPRIVAPAGMNADAWPPILIDLDPALDMLMALRRDRASCLATLRVAAATPQASIADVAVPTPSPAVSPPTFPLNPQPGEPLEPTRDNEAQTGDGPSDL